MTEHGTPPAGERAEQLPEDRVEVRIFTLADHAATPPDRKLYINGGGVEQMWLPSIPGGLGPLWGVIRIRFPWHMTSDRADIRVHALDGDRRQLGPGPVLQAEVEIGRAPGQRPGDEVAVTIVFPLTGFPVQSEGTIYFHLQVAGEVLSILPLKVTRLQTGPAVIGPGR